MGLQSRCRIARACRSSSLRRLGGTVCSFGRRRRRRSFGRAVRDRRCARVACHRIFQELDKLGLLVLRWKSCKIWTSRIVATDAAVAPVSQYPQSHTRLDQRIKIGPVNSIPLDLSSAFNSSTFILDGSDIVYTYGRKHRISGHWRPPPIRPEGHRMRRNFTSREYVSTIDYMAPMARRD
jgi:hypothetical protein